MGGRQLIDELLKRQAMDGLAAGWLGFWSAQLVEQAGVAINAGIEAAVAEGELPLLMQAMGNAYQPHPIAQLVLQRPAMQRRK
jgi:hypothetical protein